jgi:hypothetical protein
VPASVVTELIRRFGQAPVPAQREPKAIASAA